MKQYMYISIIIIIIFSTNNLYSQNHWLRTHDDSSLPIKIASFDSANVVILYWSSGYCLVYHSNDSGFNWKEIINLKNIPVVNPMNISYPAKNNIFILLSDYIPNSIHNNLLIKYDDEGKALDSFYLDESYTHPWTQIRDREIMMSDTITGIANIGTRIYLTNDGWKTFKILRPDSVDNSAITAIHIKDYNNFGFYHGNRNYYYTTDAGESFERIYLGGGVPIWDIYFLNDEIGYMIGHRFGTHGGPMPNSVIYKTIDKGKSWDIILDTVIAPDNVAGPGANQIHMINENIGTLVGGYGVVAMTNDGWKTFDRVNLKSSSASSPYLAVTYSGNRPIICVENHGVFTLIDTVYMNMGAPELISPADLSKSLLVDVSFRWTKVKDITKYVFQLAKDEKFTQIIRDDTLEVSELQTSLRWDVTGLENCTDYYWRVASLKEQTIKWSPTYTFRTRLEQGEQITPEDNAIEVVSDTTLSWHPLNNAERYHLQLSLDSQYNNLIFSQDTIRSTEHRVVDLPEKSLIYWRVRGYCFAGFGQWSPTWHFTTMNKSSVSEPNIVSSIHPNPATEYITINAAINPTVYRGVDEVSEIKIYNTLGECVMTSPRQTPPSTGSGSGNLRIDVSQLARGVYYIRIGSRTQMFVKM